MPSLKQFETKEEYNSWFCDYRKRNIQKTRKYAKEYMACWRKKNGYAANEKWKKKNPEKLKVHRIAQKALKLEIIEKEGCEVCGNKKSVMHHDDYMKPLIVRWLCHVHHREQHYTKTS